MSKFSSILKSRNVFKFISKILILLANYRNQVSFFTTKKTYMKFNFQT